jgi:hypothetical protein
VYTWATIFWYIFSAHMWHLETLYQKPLLQSATGCFNSVLIGCDFNSSCPRFVRLLWGISQNDGGWYGRTQTSCWRTTPFLYRMWGFQGSDYEECRLLGYKNPVPTSRETHYVSATEPSRLMLCKIWCFHGSEYEECHILGYKTQFLPHGRHITSPLQSPAG